jgi:hypothetical protein
MKKGNIAVIAFCSFALLISGCYKDNWEAVHPASTAPKVCDTTSVMSYQKNVIPIFNTYACASASCHSTAGNAGNVILDTYAGTLAAVTNKRLILTINRTQPSGKNQFWMPYNLPKMDDCSINQVSKWARAGCPNN